VKWFIIGMVALFGGFISFMNWDINQRREARQKALDSRMWVNSTVYGTRFESCQGLSSSECGISLYDCKSGVSYRCLKPTDVVIGGK
jgi:hypothetical protein